MADDNSKAMAAASVTVLSWSTVAAAFKTALQYFSHFEMLLVASATATIIFAISVSLSGNWRLVADISKKDWGKLAFLGFFNPTLYYLVLFAAYENLPAQVAQPINYCWPIFLVILLALVAHKPVRPRLYIGMALSLSGVACISLGGSSLNGINISPQGVALAFLSALLWAVYWILNNRAASHLNENLKLFFSFLFGTIYLSIGSIFVECDLNSTSGMLSSVYVGAFEMGIPFIFFSYALSHARNVALVNQMCYIAPFLSLFFISVIVGESISPATFVGLALIVGGVVFNQYLAYRPAVRA